MNSHIVYALGKVPRRYFWTLIKTYCNLGMLFARL